MRKTKIVCTIGPACESEEVLTAMCEAGMNVARLNFSHGTHPEQQQKVDLIKKVREKLHLPIAIMLDTKGPEYRIRTFQSGKITLREGDRFAFTTEQIVGDEHRVAVSYAGLVQDLAVGDKILLNNGLLSFEVEELTATDAICRVLVGGETSNNKSMSFPNKVLNQVYLSEQDKADILFGIRNGVDYIACSFVSRREDLEDIQRFLDENGAGKRVITATEMLESMIQNARPTRAEISDVANAVYDGSSAIMLSGETAVGKYPVETVATMSRIAEETENSINYKKRLNNSDFTIKDTVDAISHATCGVAVDIGAKAIVACSLSGMTVRMVSRFRPPVDIIGLTTNERTWRLLALSWGVTPMMCDEFASTDVLFYTAQQVAKEVLHLEKGDKIVITGGVTNGRSGNTNLLKVEQI